MATFPPVPQFAHVAPMVPYTIKLGLETNDTGKEIPFLRIAVVDVNQPELMDHLKERALELWSQANLQEVDRNVVKVLFTFRDSDNDLCYILNHGDLRHALQTNTGALRIFAKVVLPTKEDVKVDSKAKTEQSQPKEASQEKPKYETSPPAASQPRVTSPPTSQASQDRSVPINNIPVNKMVEAVVGVLTTAAVALQNSQPPSAPRSSTSSATATQTETTAASDTTEAEADENKARPFIHGRHTCDGCLTTPIIGIRFHATNLPDYDLCQTCKENYRGDEIKFEPSELERDQPMQERWNRRFNRWAKGRRCGPRRAPVDRSTPGVQNSGVQNNGNGTPPHPCGPPHFRARRGHRWNNPHCFGPPPEQCGPPPEEVDAALKEAIRRSMKDVEHAQPTVPVEATLKDPPVETEKPPVVAAQPTVPFERTAAPIEERKPDAVEELRVNTAPTEDTGVSIDKSLVSGGEELEIAAKDALDEDEIVVQPSEPEIIVDEIVEQPSEPEIIVETVLTAEEEIVVESVTEESFAKDAEGHGDAACALGATMDKLANFIDEFQTELGRSPTSLEASADISDAGHSTFDIEAGETASGGQTIVDGEDEAQKADDKTHDSWEVVRAEQQLAEDEALARAAQVIGSALFQSDNSIKREGMVLADPPRASTAASATSSITTMDSVPTTLPSVTSVEPLQLGEPKATLFQHARWAVQLEQLRELGFTDDNMNVEVMERLEAADIGSSEKGEVSVTRVVNELMKNW